MKYTLLNQKKELLFSTLVDKNTYRAPVDEALNLVLEDDRPLKIANARKYICCIMRLQVFDDRFFIYS